MQNHHDYSETNHAPAGLPSGGKVVIIGSLAAIGISVVLHGILIAALAIWYVKAPAAPVGETAIAQSSTASAPQEFQPPPPEPSPDVSSSQVNTTLERVTDSYEEKSPEEQLGALEEQAAELEKLANEESIDEIAAKFREWTNIDERASQPADAPSDAAFDFDTGQLHDVVRAEDADGNVTYRSTLVDAGGNTFEVEMTGEEGEQAYRTMQTLKQYPLAEKVYRQMAMPLLDRAIQAKRNAANDDNEAGDPDIDDRDPFDES